MVRSWALTDLSAQCQDPSVMAWRRVVRNPRAALARRGASEPGTKSKAAPPRAASSHALGASVHGPGASQLGATRAGDGYVDLFVGSFNFGIDQLMLQGMTCI